jgi:hypothetical protein
MNNNLGIIANTYESKRDNRFNRPDNYRSTRRGEEKKKERGKGGGAGPGHQWFSY